MGHAQGVIAAREPGVVAGLAVAELVFVYAVDREVQVTDRVPTAPGSARATS